MSIRCPHCESGELAARTISEVIRYGTENLSVPNVQISVCSACAEEVVSPAQAKANEVLFADAKRQHDGLLTSAEIREWRRLLRLSQADAAKILGGGVNAFSKYERGEVMQSKSMDLLMRVCKAVPAAFQFLVVRAGVSSDRIEGGRWFNVQAGAQRAASVHYLRPVGHPGSQMQGANDAAWHDAPDLRVAHG